MADSSKDIQLRELKDMIHDLQKMIKTLQATVDAANKREEALTQERKSAWSISMENWSWIMAHNPSMDLRMSVLPQTI